jgi:hypothetical protein
MMSCRAAMAVIIGWGCHGLIYVIVRVVVLRDCSRASRSVYRSFESNDDCLATGHWSCVALIVIELLTTRNCDTSGGWQSRRRPISSAYPVKRPYLNRVTRLRATAACRQRETVTSHFINVADLVNRAVPAVRRCDGPRSRATACWYIY